MRPCPFADCPEQVPETRFACHRHWAGLTPPQKERLHHAWRLFRRGALAIDQLTAIEQEIVAEAKGGPPIARCRGCGAPVLWVKTEGGHLLPVNAEPDDRGKILLEGGVARVLADDLFDAAREGPRYLAHWAVCPNADRFRRRRKK